MATKKQESIQRWDQLLSPDKFRESSKMRHALDKRNVFESDFTRVVLSSSFRRLQDKTQVFPLQETDFIRTRLTHSIEVSTIGKSIGRSVEEGLIDAGKLGDIQRNTISTILAATGLIHDIGNPPFGHFGESAIRDYFTDFFNDTKNKQARDLTPFEQQVNKFNERQRADFTKFDGNVQTFRILRKLQYMGDEFSYNLSFPTLATVIKYPFNSEEGNKKSDSVSRKKFGYFISEERDYAAISKRLGIKNFRHPITFLLEAADDIAYSIADIEDGFKKRLIEIDTFNEYLRRELKGKPNAEEKKLMLSIQQICESIDKSYKDWQELVIQKIRIEVQSFMIIDTVQTFMVHHDPILTGEFDQELLKAGKAHRVKKALGDMMAEKILTSKEIIELELVGHKVITTLLRYFTHAMVDGGMENSRTKSGKLFNLISSNYRFIFEKYSRKTAYDKLRLITDYISGMTDSYAFDLYQKLRAIKL